MEDGEFPVLIGPSGCGKSTTLRMLAGLETLSGGEIFFDGKPVSRLEPKARDIAMVFQDYALYPHMNIARNMSFALRLARQPKAEVEAKVQKVATMLNIAHLLDRKPGELSGGQRQRVAMAVRWCAMRQPFCSTSHFRTLMPSCACRCALKSAGCIRSSTPP